MYSHATTRMEFRAYISDDQRTLPAMDAIAGQVASEFDTDVDLACFFFTAEHREEAQRAAGRFCDRFDPKCLIGCSAEGIIGLDREIERGPGLSLLVGRLPRVRIHPFHIGQEDWQDILDDQQVLEERLAYGTHTRALIGLGDPFSTPVGHLLSRLDQICPGLPLIGGMASSARKSGENLLLINDKAYEEGMVGVSLAGAVQVQTAVSQGCRPVGKAMIVTRARDNVVEQLGGRPALAALHETLTSIPEAEQELFSNGLFLGIAISEYREQFRRGDFLIRNVIGADQESGAIMVADRVRVGRTVQFHVRDAQTATEDLDLILQSQLGGESPAGALLFSCNGRGTRMFPRPSHDIGRALAHMPQTPIAGFFAAGELGPVGDRNFIHGHTASFALLRPG